MSRPRMRPSFCVEVASSAACLRSVIEEQLVLEAEEVEGTLSAEHAVLQVPVHQRRIWTPSLDLTLEADEGSEQRSEPDRSKLWGTFSPRAEIWTGFVFTIAILAILSLFASVFGIAQVVLGHEPFALLVPVVSIGVAALLYLSALVGQGLSIAEMYRLRAFVDDCLREAENRTRERPADG